MQAEEVGERGCGDLGCQIGQCGPASGLGSDAEGPESFGEPCPDDGAAGQQPEEQPTAILSGPAKQGEG